MKYKKLILIIIITFAATLLYVSSYAGEFIEPARKDKCPVCGMFVHKYPKWVAEIIFKDGTHAVFDGPKDTYVEGLLFHRLSHLYYSVQRSVFRSGYRHT